MTDEDTATDVKDLITAIAGAVTQIATDATHGSRADTGNAEPAQ